MRSCSPNGVKPEIVRLSDLERQLFVLPSRTSHQNHVTVRFETSRWKLAGWPGVRSHRLDRSGPLGLLSGGKPQDSLGHHVGAKSFELAGVLSVANRHQELLGYEQLHKKGNQ